MSEDTGSRLIKVTRTRSIYLCKDFYFLIIASYTIIFRLLFHGIKVFIQKTYLFYKLRLPVLLFLHGHSAERPVV